jgi:DNA primase
LNKFVFYIFAYWRISVTKISLEDVADYLEDYKPYTGYSMSICPFHDDHNPSMSIGEGGYKCKSCGAKGSLEKLYEHVSGRLVIHEKKTWNPSALIWDKWKDRFGSIPQIAKVAHNNLKQSPELAHYLEVRKIDSEIKKLYLGYLDGWYLFPIRNEYDEIGGVVARASPTIQTKQVRYSVSKNCPVKLYVPNWRSVLRADELYIPFGTVDAVTLQMCGYASLTGISGQELNASNLGRFRKRIWIIPDRGEERKALELQTQLGWRGQCLFLDYPDGMKDPNQVFVEYGKEKLEELILCQKEKFIYE